MALTTYLYRKTAANRLATVNECRAMLYTVDPALTPSDTAAERLALATAAAETAMGLTAGDLDAGYFDATEVSLGAASGGLLDADGDNIVFVGFGDSIETVA